MKGDEKQRKKIKCKMVMISKIYNSRELVVNDYLANQLACPRDFIIQKRKKRVFLIPF